jgi:hypothetical protein
MKLTELFPEAVKVKILDKEYSVVFGTRALIQLERDYPDEKKRAGLLRILPDKKEENPQMQLKIGGTVDLVNLLYAGLLHTKAFPDKDLLIDAIEPRDYPDYINAIFSAFINSQATPEQLEKMEVLAESSKSKKNEEPAITVQSMPSIDQSAD